MESAASAIISLIRQESKSGRLIAQDEILRRLSEQNNPPLQAEELEELLRKVTNENEDLYEGVSGDGSRHYYSTRFMTESYAELLLKRKGDPLQLIAQIVRQQSADYPRPVPLDLFTEAPFSFPYLDLVNALNRMGNLEEFRDITQTTTKSSRVFLYSALYLEPEHASMLAEWLDAGQAENP